MLNLIVVLAVGMGVAAATGSRLLAGAWLALVIGAAVLFGTRFAYRLEADEHEVRWRTLLRRGRVPAGAVRALRPSRLVPPVLVLDCDWVTGPLVGVGPGFEAFVAGLELRCPQVRVDLGPWEDRSEPDRGTR